VSSNWLRKLCNPRLTRWRMTLSEQRNSVAMSA
jgi:hypothetical protein